MDRFGNIDEAEFISTIVPPPKRARILVPVASSKRRIVTPTPNYSHINDDDDDDSNAGTDTLGDELEDERVDETQSNKLPLQISMARRRQREKSTTGKQSKLVVALVRRYETAKRTSNESRLMNDTQKRRAENEKVESDILRPNKSIPSTMDKAIDSYGSMTRDDDKSRKIEDALFMKSKRYISEDFLNSVADRLPFDYRQRLLNRSVLPRPNPTRQRVQVAKPLPEALTRIVRRLRLLDEPDYLRRYQSVVAYCKLSNFSFSTTVAYLRKLRDAKLFGEDNNDDVEANENIAISPSPLSGTALLRRYKLDRAQFNNKVHTRLVDDRVYAKYVSYLTNNLNVYTAPLLLAFYTGLRNVEIRQLTNRSLKQLRDGEKIITDVMRKRSKHAKLARVRQQEMVDETQDDAATRCARRQARLVRNRIVESTKATKRRRDKDDDESPVNDAHLDGGEGSDGGAARAVNHNVFVEPQTPWMPIYTNPLIEFVKHLCALYDHKLKAFETSAIIVSLFDVKSPATLSNRMKCEFFKATGQRLPYGFGLHGNRTTLATIAYERTLDINFVNRFLAHKSTKTTETYVKPNILAMERKFQRISRAHFAPMLNDFDKALGQVARNNSIDAWNMANFIRNDNECLASQFEDALHDIVFNRRSANDTTDEGSNNR